MYITSINCCLELMAFKKKTYMQNSIKPIYSLYHLCKSHFICQTPPPPIKFCPYLRMNIANTSTRCCRPTCSLCLLLLQESLQQKLECTQKLTQPTMVSKKLKMLKGKKQNNTYTIQNLHPIGTIPRKSKTARNSY